MHTIRREIESPQDFELGLGRTSRLSYVADCPDGPARGLVFLIPGFGADTDSSYAESLRRHVVEIHGMIAVSVRYHCFGSRPATGAKVEVETKEVLTLIGLAAVHKVKLGDPGDVVDVAKRLAAAGVPAVGRGLLKPAGGESQNFGVVQALDHLAVLGDLLTDGPNFDTRQIVALGSSHGGYIAHMMAKIAPRTLALVIDNSSYTQPPIDYLGMASSVEYTAPLVEGVTLRCRTESAWTFGDRFADTFYDRDRDLIRDMAYPPHLRQARLAAGETATVFRMVNSSTDTISRPSVKQRQVAALRALGFDAQLLIVEEQHLDGRLFKTLDHGLNASLTALFDLGIESLAPRERGVDMTRGTRIAYEGVDKTYQFDHFAHGTYVEGRVTSRFFEEGDDDQAGPVLRWAAA